jgi:hypothetical protein
VCLLAFFSWQNFTKKEKKSEIEAILRIFNCHNLEKEKKVHQISTFSAGG